MNGDYMSPFTRTSTGFHRLLQFGPNTVCKCGFTEAGGHSFFGNVCHRFEDNQPVTRFTPEDRMCFADALADAYSRRCQFEIPERCFGCVEVTICGRQIPASSDPCVDFCFKHLTEGVGQ